MKPPAAALSSRNWSRNAPGVASASDRLGGRDEVLALEVLDQRVIAVETRRRALEGLAAEAEVVGERRLVDDRLPARWAGGDRGSDGMEGVSVRAPGAAGQEDVVGSRWR